MALDHSADTVQIARDALYQAAAWVKHWQDDVAAGLAPTSCSLTAALVGISEALAVIEDRKQKTYADVLHAKFGGGVIQYLDAEKLRAPEQSRGRDRIQTIATAVVMTACLAAVPFVFLHCARVI